MRTVFAAVATIACLQGLKHLFGYGAALTVSVAVMAFVAGAIWEAGRVKRGDSA